MPAKKKLSVIDLGQRVCTSGMMIEIALRLGLESLLEGEAFQRYAQEVVPVIRQSACIGAFALLRRFNDVEARQSELRSPLYHNGHYAKYSFADVIGQSEAIRRTKETLARMALSESPALQIKLLRALQEREVMRMGATASSMWTCASRPPPTRPWSRRSGRAPSAGTSTTASAPCPHAVPLRRLLPPPRRAGGLPSPLRKGPGRNLGILPKPVPGSLCVPPNSGRISEGIIPHALPGTVLALIICQRPRTYDHFRKDARLCVMILTR